MYLLTFIYFKIWHFYIWNVACYYLVEEIFHNYSFLKKLLFLLIFQMNFRIMLSSFRKKKKNHLGLWKELDSTYILIHEPLASSYYAALPFGKMTCSGSFFLSFVFAGLTLWSKWNFSEYCEMRIKTDSFSRSQFSQIPVFA